MNKTLPVKIKMSIYRIGFGIDSGIEKESITENIPRSVPIRLETGEIMCSESGSYIVLENLLHKYKKK
jgi:hypothetical protein